MFPGAQLAVTSGSATGAGVIASATMQGLAAAYYTVLLDASALATSTITVAIQVLDVGNSTYVTPSGIGNPNNANPITVTNGTVPALVQIPGPLPGIQINVTSFGTATGTFRVVIVAV